MYLGWLIYLFGYLTYTCRLEMAVYLRESYIHSVYIDNNGIGSVKTF